MAIRDLRQRGPLLRIALFAISILAIIFLSLASWYTGMTINGGAFYMDGWAGAIIGPAATGPGWTFLYSFCIIVVIAAQGTYHPGIDVGFDLIGCLANIAFSATMFWFFGAEAAEDIEFRTNRYGETQGQPDRLTSQFLGLGFTSGLLLFILAGFHFVFFVVSCKATHARRLRKGLEFELGDVGPKRKVGHAPAYSA